MHQLTLGVASLSSKPSERRLPIHPRHLERIDADLRSRIYLEKGYGAPYGVTDDDLSRLVAGLRSRNDLISDCDVLLLPKPQVSDRPVITVADSARPSSDSAAPPAAQ